MTKPEQSPKPRGLNMLAQATAVAIFGVVIGSGATAFTYHAVLGGAEKIEKIEQVALTVEHSRIVNDEVLAVLKKIEAKLDEAPKSASPTMPPLPPLPSMPAQHQIDAAIDGLFESLGDVDAAQKPAPADTQAEAASNDQGSNAAERNGIKKNASDEAGAAQKGNE